MRLARQIAEKFDIFYTQPDGQTLEMILFGAAAGDEELSFARTNPGPGLDKVWKALFRGKSTQKQNIPFGIGRRWSLGRVKKVGHHMNSFPGNAHPDMFVFLLLIERHPSPDLLEQPQMSGTAENQAHES